MDTDNTDISYDNISSPENTDDSIGISYEEEEDIENQSRIIKKSKKSKKSRKSKKSKKSKKSRKIKKSK